MKRIICCVSLLLGIVLISNNVRAAAPEYFKGKTIRLMVGNSVGGAMDDWARFVAHYLGKQIPGTPAIIIQNMPGAAGIIAANYVYNIAKPDGSNFRDWSILLSTLTNFCAPRK